MRNKRPLFAYDANYLIDNKLGVIFDAEGARANRVEENRAARRRGMTPCRGPRRRRP